MANGAILRTSVVTVKKQFGYSQKIVSLVKITDKNDLVHVFDTLFSNLFYNYNTQLTEHSAAGGYVDAPKELTIIMGNLAHALLQNSPLLIIQSKSTNIAILPQFIMLNRVVSFLDEMNLANACTFMLRLYSKDLKFVCDSSIDYQAWMTAFKLAFDCIANSTATNQVLFDETTDNNHFQASEELHQKKAFSHVANQPSSTQSGIMNQPAASFHAANQMSTPKQSVTPFPPAFVNSMSMSSAEPTLVNSRTASESKQSSLIKKGLSTLMTMFSNSSKADEEYKESDLPQSNLNSHFLNYQSNPSTGANLVSDEYQSGMLKYSSTTAPQVIQPGFANHYHESAPVSENSPVSAYAAPIISSFAVNPRRFSNLSNSSFVYSEGNNEFESFMKSKFFDSKNQDSFNRPAQKQMAQQRKMEWSNELQQWVTLH